MLYSWVDGYQRFKAICSSIIIAEEWKVIFLIVEYQLLRKNSSKELVSESELSI
jgi:hypothetical protein